METWILSLKAVISVILVSEFLKELLLGNAYKKYIQFAVSLFIFGALLSSFLQSDFSFPQFPEEIPITENENLLIKQYETEIQHQIAQTLSAHGLSYERISVTLSPQYEIEHIQIETFEDSNEMDAVMKGDFPYEVVRPPEK